MENVKYKGQQRYIWIETKHGGYWKDNKEFINFLRSKYIPGNGPHHRLGKDAA